jgi:F-type H+-transporting ATPase subunit delta
MISKELSLARRYAQAFLNISFDELEMHDLPALKGAIDYFDTHRSVLSLLKVSLIGPEEKIQALSLILIERFKLPAAFNGLVNLLVVGKRAFLIQQVLKLIYELYQERAKIMIFTISSASPLADDEKKMLETFLTRTVPLNLIYDYLVDPELIAGVRMQSNRYLWQYSIADTLHRARQSLMKEIG